MIKVLHSLLKVNIIIVSYRGFGSSEGTPSEEGLMIDSEAIINFTLNDLNDKINIKDVYIMGRSLGGAVGIYIVNHIQPDIKGLIIENTFLSMDDLVDKIFPFLKHVKKFVLNNHWPSKQRIKNIKLPMLFFMSGEDELIPVAHMEELYSLAENSVYKTKFLIPNGTHNESWNKAGKKYFVKFGDFLKKCGSEVEIEEYLVESNSSINEDADTTDSNNFYREENELFVNENNKKDK